MDTSDARQLVQDLRRRYTDSSRHEAAFIERVAVTLIALADEVDRQQKLIEYLRVERDEGTDALLALRDLRDAASSFRDFVSIAIQSADRLLSRPLNKKKACEWQPVPINVNGAHHVHPQSLVSYDDILAYAGYEPGRIISVTYTTGGESRILAPGQTVRVAGGACFDVCDTSNA